MKTIKGIDEKIKHFEEAPGSDNLPTFRKMFLLGVGSQKGANGEEAISLYSVGLKIRDAKDSVELEDADFNLLKKACNDNPAAWLSFYHGQVLLKLKEAEGA